MIPITLIDLLQAAGRAIDAYRDMYRDARTPFTRSYALHQVTDWVVLHDRMARGGSRMEKYHERSMQRRRGIIDSRSWVGRNWPPIIWDGPILKSPYAKARVTGV
jgi:hypothetical protein